MNTKLIFRSALASVLTLLVAVACGPSKPQILKVNPAYAKYVSAYTSGVIARKSAIRIELAEPITGLATTNGEGNGQFTGDTTLLKDIFQFEPEIEGRAVWVNERVIEFIPKKDLPVNQFYDVDFDLERVAKVPGEFENFHFQFSTYAQTMFVKEDGLKTYADYAYEWQYLEGEITLSDQEEPENLVKALSASQQGRKLHLKVEHQPYYENENRYIFRVDSVQRLEHASEVQLNWEGSAIQSTSHGSLHVKVPARGDFALTSAHLHEREDQYITLNFSEAIARSQDLNGIIRLDGVQGLTFAIDGNEVTVYLPNHVVGEKWLHISQGIRNTDGHAMQKEAHEKFNFSEPKPLVRIKGNGSILPNSQGLIFPFEAVSLKSVSVRVVRIFEQNVHHFLQVNDLDEEDGLTRYGKVIAEKKIRLDYDKSMNLNEWNSHVIDLSKLIKPQLGAIYRVAIKFDREDAMCNCPETDEAENEDSEEDWSEAEEEPVDEDYPNWTEKNWHGYGFGGGYDSWYYYDDDYSPCSNNYYEGKAVGRNILASDLGLVFKLDENKLTHAYVNNMLTTQPVANAEISYYTYAKELIASGKTNAEGKLEIPLSEKPFLMVARYGDQRGYLKLLDGQTNSLSKFDVEGEVVQKGVKGFIYGERGVWRPGDSLYLNFVLEDKQKRLPASHPVRFELLNPAGQQVYEVTKTKALNGMYDFATRTASEAPTGNYTANVYVGNRIFSKNLKIETVKPNRLKIYLDVADNASAEKEVHLAAKWLHGAPARNLDANVKVSLRQKKTVFNQFKKYIFDSPLRRYRSDDETVFAGSLNEKGQSDFRAAFSSGNTAPGKLEATFFTRVFEAGGDFSIDRQKIEYSPYRRYVGILTPDSKSFDHSLMTGETHQFNIVSVDEQGKLTSAKKLEIKVYQIEWRWWYERDEQDLISYMARAGTLALKDTIVHADNGRANFRFKVNYPDYGRYLITVTDLESGHQTGTEFTVDWPFWSRGNRQNSENASMLSFACDKERYTKGEEVKLSFPSPEEGRALVSIESSNKVLRSFWVKTTKGETTTTFEATGDMAPNAYLHVTMIQPHANTKNDLPIRMYGVIPIMVDDPATHLDPVIVTADSWRPESKANVKVRELHGKKMTYTLAVVDEGLLDLTGFRTPQPWDNFYAREALGVKTWDMYDEVIGAYSGKLDKLLSIGGDGENDGGNGAKASRFKPMVRHLGPFVLEPGETANHSIDVPNYVGSVRVMVVSAQDAAYGSAEATVAVKKPLMLLASLPRVLGPGEEVALPVNVFAMENHVKDVKITIESNDMLVLAGAAEQKLKFAEPGDEVVNFRFKVADQLGIARIKVKAVSGNETAYETIEVDVRSANPRVVDGTDFVLEPGKNWSDVIRFTGLKGTNMAYVEFSQIPSLGLEKRLDYLITYPHGCIEQTTSGAFPQLYVDQLMEVDSKQQAQIDEHVKKALKRLQLFQTINGGFAYWPGQSDESEWGTNYAGHFMLEAEKQGYAVPQNLRNRWVKYQQDRARNWGGSDQLTQAYRLHVLALSGNPEMGAMNRLRETPGLNVQAKWRLAAAYHQVGQDEVAKRIIAKEKKEFAPYRELTNTFGSDFRDRAMVLETLSLLNMDQAAGELVPSLAERLNSKQWLSTQETAYGLLAMCTYARTGNHAGNMNIAYKLGDKKHDAASKRSMLRLQFNEKEIADKKSFSVLNNGKTRLYGKLMVAGVPKNGDVSAKQSHLRMDVEYKDMQGNRLDVSRLTQGQDFVAEVTLHNPGKKGNYYEMALLQIFPSGWEIHNGRLGDEEQSNPTTYQDIRDDRVYSYYNLGTDRSITIRVQLNATYQGKFYLPTVYSEAMYDNLISARVPGKWVEVVGNKKASAQH